MTGEARSAALAVDERSAVRLRWFLFACIAASMVLVTLMFVDAARWGSQAFIPLAAAFAALLAGMVVVLLRTAPPTDDGPIRQ